VAVFVDESTEHVYPFDAHRTEQFKRLLGLAERLALVTIKRPIRVRRTTVPTSATYSKAADG